MGLTRLSTGVAFNPAAASAAPEEREIVSRVAAALHINADTCIHVKCYGTSGASCSADIFWQEDVDRSDELIFEATKTPLDESRAENHSPNSVLVLAVVAVVAVFAVGIAFLISYLVMRKHRYQHDGATTSKKAPAATKAPAANPEL